LPRRPDDLEAPGDSTAHLLGHTAELASDYLASLGDRPVGPRVDREALRTALGGPLPTVGEPPRDVIDRLASGADPGLVASAGPRYFGAAPGVL
jgi:hypothetical protein